MIKILKSTFFNGECYVKDEIYTVDYETANRWIANGIAEAAELSDLTDDELFKIAEERKIDLKKAGIKNREQLLEALLLE